MYSVTLVMQQAKATAVYQHHFPLLPALFKGKHRKKRK